MRIVCCPLCKKKMEIVHLGGVEIDKCDRCEGVWLDRGELEQLIEQERERIATAVQSGAKDITSILDETLGKIFD